MHVSADVATSGGGVAEGEAVSWYTDTITNNSTKTAQVDLSFTVDGILAVSNFDRSQLEIGYSRALTSVCSAITTAAGT